MIVFGCLLWNVSADTDWSVLFLCTVPLVSRVWNRSCENHVSLLFFVLFSLIFPPFALLITPLWVFLLSNRLCDRNDTSRPSRKNYKSSYMPKPHLVFCNMMPFLICEVGANILHLFVFSSAACRGAKDSSYWTLRPLINESRSSLSLQPS